MDFSGATVLVIGAVGGIGSVAARWVQGPLQELVDRIHDLMVDGGQVLL